ncbi:hypothetical protein OCOJLMKI_5084 [Methylobacterium iners]|uniref:Uncharacterized protein n=2 Tax=Methylobacterium iners TaxID=418707 RepID=A0ABQ4S845_9HYPH|nr:hypothetical protein OCOJLMKI_5084 [Methylobacterium iners]
MLIPVCMGPRKAISSSFDIDGALLDEAIGALRIAGRIVQRQAEEIGGYTVDGGPPLTDGQVVALAWDTGLMNGSERAE